MGVVFDKLGFMRKLEGGGDFTRPQAERLTEAFYDAVVESVATKQDLGDVRSELKQDINELRSELKDVRAELKQELSQVKSEVSVLRSEIRADVAQLKVWAAGNGVAIVSVMSALKFFS